MKITLEITKFVDAASNFAKLVNVANNFMKFVEFVNDFTKFVKFANNFTKFVGFSNNFWKVCKSCENFMQFLYWKVEFKGLKSSLFMFHWFKYLNVKVDMNVLWYKFGNIFSKNKFHQILFLLWVKFWFIESVKLPHKF